MTNTELLQSVITDSGISISFLAGKIGLSRSAFYQKMQNESEFRASEIAKITDVLHLSTSIRDRIFFAK